MGSPSLKEKLFESRRCDKMIGNRGSPNAFQCPNWAMRGGNKCRRHVTGVALSSMNLRVTRDVEVYRQMSKAQKITDVDAHLNERPHDIFQRNLARAEAIVEALEFTLAEQGDHPNAYTVTAYRQAISEAARLAKDAAGMNIDERRQQVQEADIRRVAEALKRSVKNPLVEMDELHQDILLSVFAEEMRADGITS